MLRIVDFVCYANTKVAYCNFTISAINIGYGPIIFVYLYKIKKDNLFFRSMDIESSFWKN